MRTEPRLTRRFSLGWVLAFAMFGIALPVGAWGSGGTTFNLSDKSGTTVSDDARITNNKLGTAVCSVTSAGVSSTNCAGVVGGAVKVGDGSGPMTVDGTVKVADAAGPLTVDGTVTGRPGLPATPYTNGCAHSSIEFFVNCQFSVTAGGPVAIETVNVHVRVPTGQKVHAARIQVQTGGVYRSFHTLLALQGSQGGYDHYVQADNQLKVYADGGAYVIASISRPVASGSVDVTLQVSGHR